MNPSVATLIFVCGIAGLFYLDRDETVRTSKALWLPVVYFWIIGSRSVSDWLNIRPSIETNVQLEGSPLDAAIFGVLLLASIVVLTRRKKKTLTLLRANWPILIYFFYCLISAAWSHHPDVSLKRWIKATTDLTVALIIVTDTHPMVAFRRLITRVGFVLLPTSVLFIKYYGSLGRGYTPNGLIENVGVTTNKNVLGVELLVISLGALWQVINLVRDKKAVDRRRHLLAHGVLLAFGVVLLKMADSKTSVACFMLGAGLILVTNLRAFRGRAARVHAVCLILVVVGAVAFSFSGTSDVASALGRNSNLSGRTEIWALLIPTVPNPIIGAGFESYWISPSVEELWNSLSAAGWWHPEILVTEAHNGYIELYLNLGWVGIGLVAAILLSGYRRAIAAFRVNPSVGSLTLAYVIASAVYSITEAGFRSPNPIWIFLLFAIICSTGVTVGYVGEPLIRKRTGSSRISSVANAQTKWALNPVDH